MLILSSNILISFIYSQILNYTFYSTFAKAAEPLNNMFVTITLITLILVSLFLTFAKNSEAIHKVLGLLLVSIFVVFLWIFQTEFIFVYLVYILAFIGAVLMLFLSVVLMLPISTIQKSSYNIKNFNILFFSLVWNYTLDFFNIILWLIFFINFIIFIKFIYIIYNKQVKVEWTLNSFILIIKESLFQVILEFFDYGFYVLLYCSINKVSSYQNSYYQLRDKFISYYFGIFKIYDSQFPLVKPVFFDTKRFFFKLVNNNNIWINKNLSPKMIDYFVVFMFAFYVFIFKIFYAIINLNNFYYISILFIKLFNFIKNQIFEIFEFILQFYLYINIFLLLIPILINNNINVYIFNSTSLNVEGLANIKNLLYENNPLFLIISTLVLLVALIGAAVMTRNKQ